MNTHTPIPWEQWKMTSGKYGIGRVIRPSNSVDRVSDRIESKEDAAFIVKAVNSHENLLALVKKYKAYIDYEAIGHDGWEPLQIEVNEAIRQASGE